MLIAYSIFYYHTFNVQYRVIDKPQMCFFVVLLAVLIKDWYFYVFYFNSACHPSHKIWILRNGEINIASPIKGPSRIFLVVGDNPNSYHIYACDHTSGVTPWTRRDCVY